MRTFPRRCKSHMRPGNSFEHDARGNCLDPSFRA
jgi:hypothetical protein